MMQKTALHLKDASLLREACYLNGAWVTGSEKHPVYNPATGEIIGHVPMLGKKETEEAVAAAVIAQKAWARLLPKERSAYLRRLFNLMIENREDLALIMTVEQGKPIAESLGEIAYAAAFFEWFAEEAKRLYGEIIPPNARNRRLLVTKEPVGVFAAITPWNFPASMITRKAAPGLAAGCAGIFRPPLETPFSALAIGVLAERAGFPPGVLNIITGSHHEIGPVLTSDARIRKFSFTGSTATGAKLLADCAPTVKRTSMELGGNAPLIIFDDADLEIALAATLSSKFRNAGQTCVCSNRILVQEGLYETFVTRLKEKVLTFKVGNGLDQGVTVGPLINEKAVLKVDALVQSAIKAGAKVVTGGKRHALGGNFYEPTILRDVPVTAEIFREEIFGPVAPLYRFKTEAEAIKLANDTPFGLASYVCTKDLGRALRVSEALEYGMVGVNEGIISTEVAPFGGVKLSGVGREGSRHGTDEFTELKYTVLGGLNETTL